MRHASQSGTRRRNEPPCSPKAESTRPSPRSLQRRWRHNAGSPGLGTHTHPGVFLLSLLVLVSVLGGVRVGAGRAYQKAFKCKLRGHNTGPCEAKVSTKPAYASVSFQNQPQATAEEAPHRDTRAETTHSQTARESKGEERNQEAETANVEPRVGSETQGGKPWGRRRGTSLVCQGRPVHGLLGPIVPIVNVSVCMRGAAFSHQFACRVRTATHHSRATTTDPGMSATTPALCLLPAVNALPHPPRDATLYRSMAPIDIEIKLKRADKIYRAGVSASRRSLGPTAPVLLG